MLVDMAVSTSNRQQNIDQQTLCFAFGVPLHARGRSILIYKENKMKKKATIEETLKIIDDEAANRLADAIILQACDDYRKAVLGYSADCKSGTSASVKHNAENTKRECERFFFGSWCKALTQLDGKVLTQKLEIDELEKVVDKYDEFLAEISNGKHTIQIVKSLKKGKKERFDIPPRLMNGFIELIILQNKTLKKQLEELNKELKKNG